MIPPLELSVFYRANSHLIDVSSHHHLPAFKSENMNSISSKFHYRLTSKTLPLLSLIIPANSDKCVESKEEFERHENQKKKKKKYVSMAYI